MQGNRCGTVIMIAIIISFVMMDLTKFLLRDCLCLNLKSIELPCFTHFSKINRIKILPLSFQFYPILITIHGDKTYALLHQES